MFFLSLILFAWLVFDWHAAVPMMLFSSFAAYGAHSTARHARHARTARTARHARPFRARKIHGALARARRAQHLREPCADAPPLSLNADMYHYALRLIGRFHLRADEMVTGKFEVNPR